MWETVLALWAAPVGPSAPGGLGWHDAAEWPSRQQLLELLLAEAGLANDRLECPDRHPGGGMLDDDGARLPAARAAELEVTSALAHLAEAGAAQRRKDLGT